MIERFIRDQIASLLRTFPAVALLGPRQVGKTTLTRELIRNSLDDVVYFDLENDEDIARMENPAFLFEQYTVA